LWSECDNAVEAELGRITKLVGKAFDGCQIGLRNPHAVPHSPPALDGLGRRRQSVCTIDKERRSPVDADVAVILEGCA